MRIYLVQHGKAKTKEEDPDRHLSEEGVQKTQESAEFIKPCGLRVKNIWHSGKPRAVQTAEILASGINVEVGLIRHDGLAPNDPVKPVIKEVEQAQGDVMIVGHLPFLGKLAGKLLAGKKETEIVVFQNSGIASLEDDSGGVWRLRWMIVPELIQGTER